MQPFKRRENDLESKIQKDIIKELTLRGWYCKTTHGNAYQSGFPDIYIASRRYGCRWVEVKRPDKYKFTQAQLTMFPKLAARRIGIWVLTAGTKFEVDKLFKPANWYTYLNKSRGITVGDEVKRIPKKGPEGEIQDSIIDKLSRSCGCPNNLDCTQHPLNNWLCMETYGSTFQTGLPDIYCTHRLYGARWIECKNPDSYKFTPSQTDVFPRFGAEGVAIYILTSSETSELSKIFGRSNWHTYMWDAL